MKKIIYSKYSNDRGKCFKIRTDICRDGYGKRTVVKRPASEEAQAHIDYIFEIYKKLDEKYNSYVQINKCYKNSDGTLSFPYLSGTTLEEMMDICYERRNEKELLGLVDKYVELVNYGADREPFVMTEAFKKIFGAVELPFDVKCTSIADIDMIFENIIVDTEGKWNIIDYEWTFLFPVPLNFVIYRGLAAFTEGLYSASNKRLEGINLYEYCGISNEEIIAYKKMIENFEAYVMQNKITMKNLHGMLGQKIYEPLKAVRDIYEKVEKQSVQIFQDQGKGFEEETSYFVDCPIEDFEKIELSIEIKEGCKSVRIDPATTSCLLSVRTIKVDDRDWEDYTVNGFKYGNRAVVYDTEDPQICVYGIEGKKRLSISAYVVLVDKKSLKEINDYANARSECEKEMSAEIERLNLQVNDQNDQIRVLEQQKYEDGQRLAEYNNKIKELETSIDEIKSTKIWKIYKKYRSIRNR